MLEAVTHASASHVQTYWQTDTWPRRKLRAIYPLLLASLDWRIVWNPQGLFFSWNFLGAGSFQKAVPFHYHTHWHMMGAGRLSWINSTYFIFLRNCIFYFDLSSSYVFLIPKALYGHFSFIQCLHFWELVHTIHKTQNRLENEVCGPELVKLQKKTEELLITGLGKCALGCHPQTTKNPSRTEWVGSILYCSLGISANAAFNLLPQCVNLLKLFM